MKLFLHICLSILAIQALSMASSQSNLDATVREGVVKKYLATTTIVADLRSNARINIETQLQSLMPNLKRIGMTFPKLVKTVVDEIDVEKIVAKSVAETYTDAEIEALHSFLQTSEGKSLIKRSTLYSQYLDRERIWYTLSSSERKSVKNFTASDIGKSINRKARTFEDNLISRMLDELKVEALLMIVDSEKRATTK